MSNMDFWCFVHFITRGERTSSDIVWGWLRGQVPFSRRCLSLLVILQTGNPSKLLFFWLQRALLSAFVFRTGPTQKTTGFSRLLGEVPGIPRELTQLWIQREEQGRSMPRMQVLLDYRLWRLFCRIPGFPHTEPEVLLLGVHLTAGDSPSHGQKPSALVFMILFLGRWS